MAENMTLAGNSEFKSWVSQLKKDIVRHKLVTRIVNAYEKADKKENN